MKPRVCLAHYGASALRWAANTLDKLSKYTLGGQASPSFRLERTCLRYPWAERRAAKTAALISHLPDLRIFHVRLHLLVLCLPQQAAEMENYRGTPSPPARTLASRH